MTPDKGMSSKSTPAKICPREKHAGSWGPPRAAGLRCSGEQAGPAQPGWCDTGGHASRGAAPHCGAPGAGTGWGREGLRKVR